MSGKCRPSLRPKTLENVKHSNLSITDKRCIEEAFRRLDEIVYCRDCKHGWANPIDGFIYCHRDGRRSYEMLFKTVSFCSFGERKDGAK